MTDAFDWFIDFCFLALGWQLRVFVEWMREIDHYYATRNFFGELHGQATEAHEQKYSGKGQADGHG